MRIGLSYDQGSPKYRLYAERLAEAARSFGFDVEQSWLAGAALPLDRSALARIDGLVLTGGADVEPHRYGLDDIAGACKTFDGRDDAELQILGHALVEGVPILAICRGLQLLNVRLGGTLIPDLSSGKPHILKDTERHPIVIAARSTLLEHVQETQGLATSSHHQAVGRLGEGLQVAARHEDGTIEAVEWAEPLRAPWLSAVQWHPERMALDEPLSGRLYKAFLAAASIRST